ncbi:unnamed protein product [Moneuplotes crassus]|uniref:NAD(P)(+)--arginine ADP-ribosyltransferase n=1 Tax=Euplotes crassus TaxID=5936 RepID=A0AAD1XN40_EUPCR|nr:unnamed protein product [Moneuplotes crassus]
MESSCYSSCTEETKASSSKAKKKKVKKAKKVKKELDAKGKKFMDLFKTTEFMKVYSKTPRESELSEVYEDICNIVSPIYKREIDKIFDDYQDDPVTAVMKLWTSKLFISEPINLALILDANATFDYDPDNLRNYFSQLKTKYKIDYDEVLKYSMKFIRMINYFIVEYATCENTKNRTTYGFISQEIFKNKEVGDTFRIPTFQRTSEDKEGALQLQTIENSGDSMYLAIYRIPKGCYNAGKIGERSKYEIEEETLIPPYTLYTVTKKERNELWLDVCKDNKSA